MKAELRPGLRHVHVFRIPETKMVPDLYPESEIFLSMPRVLATGFMIGLMEWACAEAIAPYLEAGEGSLGVAVDVTHEAATPAGMEVTVEVELTEREDRRLAFSILARDEVDVIGRGSHRRVVVDWDRFGERHARKVARWKGLEEAG